MFIPEGDTPCTQRDPELWFSKPNTDATKRAKELCHQCLNEGQCLRAALKFERSHGRTSAGVYGGQSEKERHAFLELARSITPY